jgi:hypothetical protein
LEASLSCRWRENGANARRRRKSRGTGQAAYVLLSSFRFFHDKSDKRFTMFHTLPLSDALTGTPVVFFAGGASGLDAGKNAKGPDQGKQA